MEPGTEQETSEHIGDHLMDDSRSVVLFDDPVFVLAEVIYPDIYVRKDVGLLTGIEGVVDGLLDSHEQGFGTAVESEDMFVLLEEFRDGDLALLLRKVFGDGFLRRSTGYNIVFSRGHPSGLWTNSHLNYP